VTALHDRVPERAELRRLLDAAREGLSAALVVYGDPGFGTTALLRHAIESAVEFRVVEMAGVEVEQELGFAALHRLLLPFRAERDRLPAPQRDALSTAFGLRLGPPPDRFLVGLAALTVLADVASTQPVLVVCDDAQWLDRESLDVLAFVGRRVLAERVVLLLGTRTDRLASRSFDGLPSLRVAGLPTPDAVALLTSISDLDSVLAARLADSSSGNPLVLVEVARRLSSGEAVPAQLAGDPVLHGPVPVGSHLEDRFLARVSGLGTVARTVLLIAAADSTGEIGLIHRAAVHLLPETPGRELTEAIEASERDGLLERRAPGRTVFRHPLIRSAIYGRASSAQRRRAHEALAEATDATDADRRAWHLAGAAEAPSEAVAVELERSAERAWHRGGHLAQAALLARAAELTPRPPDRATRQLAAAAAALTGGATQRAEQLLGALPEVHDGLLDARATRLRGLLAREHGHEDAVSLLVTAADGLLGQSRAEARDALLEALDAVMVVSRLEPRSTGLRVARAALALPPPDGPPDVADLVLTGHARLLVDGYAQAAPILRAAIAAMREEGVERTDTARWCQLGMLAGAGLWDEAALGVCAARYLAVARRRGAVRMHQVALDGLANWELACGRTEAAAGHFLELKDLAAVLSPDPTHSGTGDVLLRAWRGDAMGTLDAAASGARLHRQRGRVALVLVHLGAGNYQEAMDTARELLAEDPPHLGTTALPDVVEAAARAGDLVTAQAALTRLEERAAAAATPWALGLLARSRALLEPDRSAEALYVDAVDRLGRTPVLTDLARAHLLYGEWLRRRRRRADAATQLKLAHHMFLDMDASAFAERARRELVAAGGSGHPRGVPNTSTLTAQESRIVTLVANGATNQEIATTMFLSPSTVEYHLRKVFRKLGITSRRQLRHLPDR
jgi:DNA-binding CsgD family transcriptional regulator/tetratricopeptide (TPR) repeat protein